MGRKPAGFVFVLALVTRAAPTAQASLPMAISTWNFPNATAEAWKTFQRDDGSAVDAVERGCGFCEESPHLCRNAVGFGGRPDGNGETTLDAMIMDGAAHEVGAVGALRRVKNAISVARMVMEHTDHTLLAGEQATEFALQMGFKEENLTTKQSLETHKKWIDESCQPNKWKNVEPDPTTSCGPYRPLNPKSLKLSQDCNGKAVDIDNHDTIGMIAIDQDGNICAGTSTNGLRNKIPGRVGDSPIPGSGAYVDKFQGAAVATGNGDVMMRFMPTLMAVELMRSGLPPDEAAKAALKRIAYFYPSFRGALIAVKFNGEYGASCYGYSTFPYTVVNSESQSVTLMTVNCFA